MINRVFDTINHQMYNYHNIPFYEECFGLSVYSQVYFSANDHAIIELFHPQSIRFSDQQCQITSVKLQINGIGGYKATSASSMVGVSRSSREST